MGTPVRASVALLEAAVVAASIHPVSSESLYWMQFDAFLENTGSRQQHLISRIWNSFPILGQLVDGLTAFRGEGSRKAAQIIESMRSYRFYLILPFMVAV